MRVLKKRKFKSYPLKSKKKQEDTTTPKRRKIYTRNALDVRVFLSRISDELYNGELDATIAGKLAYIQNILMKSLEVGDFEERLKRIEEVLKMQKGTTNTWRNPDTKDSKLPSPQLH